MAERPVYNRYINSNYMNFISKETKIKIMISWVLVLLWASIIFYFSSKTAPESTVQSQSIIFTFAGFFGSVIEGEEEMLRIDGIVRETAHAIEYLILGALSFNALFLSLNYRKKISEIRIEGIDKYRALNCIICAILICTIYALSDEIHQLSVPGRAFQLLDLIIDFIGVVAGVLLMCFVYLKWGKRSESDK